MTAYVGPKLDPNPIALRVIASSIKPAFPDAAATLLGIAAELEGDR